MLPIFHTYKSFTAEHLAGGICTPIGKEFYTMSNQEIIDQSIVFIERGTESLEDAFHQLTDVQGAEQIRADIQLMVVALYNLSVMTAQLGMK
jgi:hypothetical protein